MKSMFIGACVSGFLLTGCSTQSPDEGVTSTAMPTPSSSSSDMQFEPSETALGVSNEVIGMTEPEAISLIEGVSSEKLTARVVRRDDENFVITMDYRLDRINLEIDGGLVTKAYVG